MILSWIPTPIWYHGKREILIKNKKINIGIGFVTGRKNFLSVVRTYLYNWNRAEEVDAKKYALHLFVAYDLKFSNTELNDYQIRDEEILSMVDSIHYLGSSAIAGEVESLVKKKVISAREARTVFGEGYAKKRNAVLYFALLNKMDALIFFDDDEYPVANVRMDGRLVWEGQPVLAAHIKEIFHADMTSGYHCGYISPIPEMQFDEKMEEEDFGTLMKAVSNDIISWETIQEKMKDGGITYGDQQIIAHGTVEAVQAVHGMKFISGANLGMNLRDRGKLYPFYNPPGARGEDTFLSTCICQNEVARIPVYTFHDGFATCGGLLSGALPNSLKAMKPHSPVIAKRFLKALVGWVRYKPLLVYLTERDGYESRMDEMEQQLKEAVPKLCDYYGNLDFSVILQEFYDYREQVKEHEEEFVVAKGAWIKMMAAW